MRTTRICSPLFLDKQSEAVLALGKPDDLMIKAAPGVGDQTESLAPIHRELADTVAKVAGMGERPYATIGDCCQVIPVLAGLERAGISPTLVWLDAHGDFNTWETTPSKFLGGMPLAMLTGRGDQRMMQAVGLGPIADTRVVLADGRDLDPGERELVLASGIHWTEDLDALAATALPSGPLYVHFDTDIIDATEAPAFLYPVKNGPSAAVMKQVLAQLMATGRVAALSVTAAWNARRDTDGATLRAVNTALEGLAT